MSEEEVEYHRMKVHGHTVDLSVYKGYSDREDVIVYSSAEDDLFVGKNRLRFKKKYGLLRADVVHATTIHDLFSIISSRCEKITRNQMCQFNTLTGAEFQTKLIYVDLVEL